MADGTDLEVIEYDDDLEPLDGEEPEASLAERQQEVTDAIEQTAADLARLAREASEVVIDELQEAGTALVPAKGTAASAKKRLAVLRASAAKQQAVIERKQEQVREKQEEMKSLMRRQMELAEEAMAPLEKFIARLGEGIWMVNLYLGRDEQIVVLRDGEPAPAEMPVAIRQMVLAMDEECAVNPDEDGIDATNIEEFDQWLQADPAHVDQVIPNLKGVVALRPRFRSKSYGDPWKDAAVREADKQTYFLIRNGDKLYRTWTEFNVGDRLVPKADEFASFFFETVRTYRRDEPDHRVPITPGTPAWERAEEASDDRQRHFMRVGLILQGLVDRTTVFHPLPEGGINFLDFEHSGRSWEFVIDEENVLTTGRQKFYDWLHEKNRNLRVGMRVVGSFTRNYSSRDDKWESRIHPSGAERPPTAELLTIEEQTPDGFIVRYKRTGEIYDPKLWVETKPGWGYRGGYKSPKRRASCLLSPEDSNLLAFDLVTEEEMLVYLGARTDRHAYAEMFPLLKAAILAKRAERAEEEPFRVMLAGVLARENGVEVADAVEALDALIEWWKLTNRNHRPLVGGEQDQAKAVRMLVAEHARRIKAERQGVSGEVVEKLRAEHPEALLIGRRRDARYVVISPERHETLGETAFVQIANYTARGNPRDVMRWKLLRKDQVARLTLAYKSERLADRDLNATLQDHLTGPEYDRLVAQMTFEAQKHRTVAIAYHAEKRRFYIWRMEADAVLDEKYPLSGEQRKVKVDESQRPWSRKGGVATLGKSQYSVRSKYTYQRKPWDTRPRPGQKDVWWNDEQVPSEAMQENKYVVVYHDAALDEHVEAEKARWEAVAKREDELSRQVRGLLGSVQQAWEKRREEEEFATFLEEYLDPELWEGHRKLLPRERFEYPYNHSSGRSTFREMPDPLYALVAYAVEQGIDLNGLTVWEAASAHFPPRAFFGKPEEYAVVDLGSGKTKLEREYVPEAIDIPADVRDLRFKLPDPEPEEDEDDDDD